MTTMLTMTPSEVRAGVIDCFEAGLVPFITSSPGMGKSSLVASIAKEFNLELIDVRLSQCAPEDLMGLPMRLGEGKEMRAAFAPFEMFPTQGTPLPAGKDGWVLLLDEANSAAKSVQAAAYKLVLDRFVGQAKLHDNVFIVLAGNLATDRAIVNSLSTAMQSRLIHMEMELSFKDFMDHAVKAKWDPRVLAFLEFQPSQLHQFKPDHTDRTFRCPRTWEFVARLINGKPLDRISLKLLAGCIGEGGAFEFHSFLQVYASLPTMAQVIADPEGIAVPSDAGTTYALAMMLLDKFERKTFPQVAKFVARLEPEFQVLVCRGINRIDPAYVRDPVVVKLRTSLVRYLTSDDEDLALAA